MDDLALVRASVGLAQPFRWEGAGIVRTGELSSVRDPSPATSIIRIAV